MRTNSYDPFGAELRRFAQNLDRRSFKAVTSGLGFGEIKRNEVIPTKPLIPKIDPLQMTRYQTPVNPPPIAVAPVFKQETPIQTKLQPQIPPLTPPIERVIRPVQPIYTPQPQSPRMSLSLKFPRPSFSFMHTPLRLMWRLLLRITMHCVDICAVTLALAVALFIGGAVFADRSASMSTMQSIMEWMPVQLLLRMDLLHFVGMIYALYAFYYVFLRLFAGVTLGGMLIGGDSTKQIEKT